MECEVCKEPMKIVGQSPKETLWECENGHKYHEKKEWADLDLGGES